MAKKKTSHDLTEIVQIRLHPGLRKEAERQAKSRMQSLGAYIRFLLAKDLDWSAPVKEEVKETPFSSFKDDGIDWFGPKKD